tara:strand:- start:1617 stop:2312 length:696 start_codon:yes stop_codon:yes gene_type:complete
VVLSAQIRSVIVSVIRQLVLPQASSMLDLYYAPHTCSLATHIALEDAGAEYRLVKVDFATGGQKDPAYITINPKARVPALATDDGVLTETPAMLAYVAQIFPTAALAPVDDPFRFAQVQAFNSFLCSTLHVAHAHRMRGYRWADDESAIASMQRKVPQSVSANFELVEKHMFQGPWVMGDAYTICDPYLFTIAQWMEADGVDPAQFPKVAAHRSRMSARPTVIEAIRQELA